MTLSIRKVLKLEMHIQHPEMEFTAEQLNYFLKIKLKMGLGLIKTLFTALFLRSGLI